MTPALFDAKNLVKRQLTNPPKKNSLAYLEMYLCLAIFFARFDMVLFETDVNSMEWLDHGVASNKLPVKVEIIAQYP